MYLIIGNSDFVVTKKVTVNEWGRRRLELGAGRVAMVEGV